MDTATAALPGASGSTGHIIARAALAGAAAGSRSLTGLAALALATPRGSVAQPERLFRNAWAQGLIAAAAATELVLDKLPQTPSRLAPAGLGARIGLGLAAGAVAARRAPGPAAVKPETPGTGPQSDDAELVAISGPAPSAAIVAGAAAAAAAAAAGTAWLGAAWRAAAGRRFGADYPGAVIEDLAAITLAWAAARGRHAARRPAASE